MKILAIVTLFLVSVTSLGAKDKDIVVTTDRFTGKTTVIMKAFDIKSPALGCMAAPCLSLMAKEQDGQIVFVVISNATGWIFPHGADVHVLADGQPIDLGHFLRGDGQVTTIVEVMVLEPISGAVGRVALDQMANAHDLEIEVGPYQCKVNPKNIRRLKEFSGAFPL
jgi:hypothetical protein